MEIAEFESAFRAVIANRLTQPLLATPDAGIQFDVRMPQEFQAAAKALAERSGRPTRENSLLRAAAQWT